MRQSSAIVATPAPTRAVHPGPVLEMRASRIVAALDGFRTAFPGIRPFYATKCNTHPGVLSTLHNAGAGFEVASVQEVDLLRETGVQPCDMLFSNPVRAREQTARAAEAGVYRFSVDSYEEVRRVAEEAPGSCVYARLITAGDDSVVPSEGKFGVDAAGAVSLLVQARELGLTPYGITFHMGSQSLHPGALDRPLREVAAIMERLSQVGITLQMVDIGGGFPARYDEPVPALELFGRVAAAGIARLPYPVEVFAEPGRALVAEAGTFRCRVIGVAERPSGWWAHTDLGVFHGLMEVLESGGNLHYPIHDTRGLRLRRCFHLTGPTCDSQDTWARNVLLSADLREGDELLVSSAGAYTSVYASRFNGFAPPRVVMI
ncbi:type III PLP-dependent enzyme [Winogradskya humida]|uniref:ornithine decarboxylase n=1 Tax=Winogradskya humida TaxID=113566 RepID=A0ABQ3ZJN7_9ACTN|nr:type III PLP-dependent enzyme [Actinoplanes humidus]GIE18767.1 ornithine decarboxylase [Actinoplanes humidus]